MPEQALPARAGPLHRLDESQWNLEVQAQILARITDGINIVSAADGRILYNNPAFEAMFGYGPGELIGQSPDILNAPEGGSPEATAAGIIQALESSGVWRGELLNRRKDGGTFWTHATITSEELPQVGRVWLAIQRDITERKRMEMALRESQRQFATLVTGTPHFMLIQDVALRYTMIVNPQLGLAPEDIIGKTDSEILTPADADKDMAGNNFLICIGEPGAVEG